MGSAQDSFQGLAPGPKDEAYFAKGDFAANGEAFLDLAKDFGAAVELLPLAL